MEKFDQRYAAGVPKDVSEADAEYLRIKLMHCKTNAEVDYYRKLLSKVQDALLVAHWKRIKAIQ